MARADPVTSCEMRVYPGDNTLRSTLSRAGAGCQFFTAAELKSLISLITMVVYEQV
jgi:hypothetical protein